MADDDDDAERALRPAEDARAASARAALEEVTRKDYLEATADGWIPGTVHPTGGYDQILVEVHIDQKYSSYLATINYARDGEAHRADGPSFTRYDHPRHDQPPRAIRQEWKIGGQLHRSDGPALTTVDQYSRLSEGVGSFRLRGARVNGINERELGKRVEQLRSWGASDPVEWAAHEVRWGKKNTRALIRAGVDTETLIECGTAGYGGDLELIKDVSAGTPLSWAVAGKS